MATLRAVATRFLRPAAIAADGLPFLAPMTASCGDSYFISFRSTASMGPLDLTMPRPTVLDIFRESASSMSEVVRQARQTLASSQWYKVDPMLLFALGLGGYLFAKDAASEESKEELSDIDILKKNLKSWIEKFKEKNKVLDKKIKELEEEKKLLKEKADLGDEKARQMARNAEERIYILHQVSQQLQGCLDAASGKGNKDGPVLKVLKLAFQALKLPLLLMGYAGTADELLALWGAIFLLCSGTAYYTMDNFWELVEEKEKALKVKAWQLLGLAPARGKCYCDISYPTVCAHCGRGLPDFEYPKTRVTIHGELPAPEVPTPSEHKEKDAIKANGTSSEHKEKDAIKANGTSSEHKEKDAMDAIKANGTSSEHKEKDAMDAIKANGTSSEHKEKDAIKANGTSSEHKKDGIKATGTTSEHKEDGMKASGTNGSEV